MDIRESQMKSEGRIRFVHFADEQIRIAIESHALWTFWLEGDLGKRFRRDFTRFVSVMLSYRALGKTKSRPKRFFDIQLQNFSFLAVFASDNDIKLIAVTFNDHPTPPDFLGLRDASLAPASEPDSMTDLRDIWLDCVGAAVRLTRFSESWPAACVEDDNTRRFAITSSPCSATARLALKAAPAAAHCLGEMARRCAGLALRLLEILAKEDRRLFGRVFTRQFASRVDDDKLALLQRRHVDVFDLSVLIKTSRSPRQQSSIDSTDRTMEPLRPMMRYSLRSDTIYPLDSISPRSMPGKLADDPNSSGTRNPINEFFIALDQLRAIDVRNIYLDYIFARQSITKEVFASGDNESTGTRRRRDPIVESSSAPVSGDAPAARTTENRAEGRSRAVSSSALEPIVFTSEQLAAACTYGRNRPIDEPRVDDFALAKDGVNLSVNILLNSTDDRIIAPSVGESDDGVSQLAAVRAVQRDHQGSAERPGTLFRRLH